MMDRKLTVKLCRTHKGEPLATVDGLPGGGADLRLGQLRALAVAQLRVAADAEVRTLVHRGKPLPDVRRDYP